MYLIINNINNIILFKKYIVEIEYFNIGIFNNDILVNINVIVLLKIWVIIEVIIDFDLIVINFNIIFINIGFINWIKFKWNIENRIEDIIIVVKFLYFCIFFSIKFLNIIFFKIGLIIYIYVKNNIK